MANHVHKLFITISLHGYTLDEYYAPSPNLPATQRTIMGPYRDAAIPAAYLKEFTNNLSGLERWLALNEFPWLPGSLYPSTNRVKPITLAEVTLS